jgi:3-oxoacyl-[acyl-carrier-protein] synthase III
MKFLAVRHAVPSTVISNDELIGRVAEANRSIVGPDRLERITADLRTFLKRVGTETRHATDGRERAVDVLRRAVDGALASAGVSADDLDFIIYAGVNRGWLEPSTASLVQREFGAKKAVCFDVGEACASWVRAVQIADSLFRSQTYGLGMIVNCECDLLHLASFELGNMEKPEDVLAAFTIGEAATATIVSAEPGDLYISTRSFGEHCDLCMIPLVNAGSYLAGYDPGLHPPGRFYSRSHELFHTTIEHLLEAYRTDPVIAGRTHDIVFSHAASRHAGEIARQAANISAERWFCTHSRFGNTVAASVPLGISVAIDEGRLVRGSRGLAAIGSAGISIALMSFTY